MAQQTMEDRMAALRRENEALEKHYEETQRQQAAAEEQENRADVLTRTLQARIRDVEAETDLTTDLRRLAIDAAEMTAFDLDDDRNLIVCGLPSP